MSSVMRVSAPSRTTWKLGVLALLGALSAAGLMWVPHQAAHAVSTVTVTPEPSSEGETTVTVSGSGFQYVPNAPDGIYVMFGVVSDPDSQAWAPSQGGQSGVTYSYAGVDGSIALIGFEGGSDAASFIDANGDWSTQLTIPGPNFVLTAGIPTGDDPVGEEVDCLQRTCGIITIGAKGMINANNETFTPVNFVAPASAEVPAAEPARDEASDVAATEAAAPDTIAAEPVAAGGSAVLPWFIGAGALLVLGLASWAFAAARKKRSAATETTGSPTTTND